MAINGFIILVGPARLSGLTREASNLVVDGSSLVGPNIK